MSWSDDVKEIERQRRMAEEMGGAGSVAFQHGRGKLTVRERVDLLADPGSFHEIGALAGTATWEDDRVAGLKPSNMVVGTVSVDGRKVAFSGGDFTIRGGASDANIARVTGLARVNGMPCGVMSNDPRFNGGSMDIAAGEKMLRLLELCETFHLPLVYFADEPGFSVGPDQERLGIVRAGARVVAALNSTQTPYICFVVRQLYGVAGGLHSRNQGLYRRYAWPSAHGGSMHIQGGTAIAYKREIEAADDPEAKRAEIEARLHAISSPFRNAHAFGVEEIIDPRDTRPLLVDFMRDPRRVVAAELLGPAKGPSYRP